jgi:hypothetical protein
LAILARTFSSATSFGGGAHWQDKNDPKNKTQTNIFIFGVVKQSVREINSHVSESNKKLALS